MHHHSSISKFPIPSMGRRVYSPKSMVNFYGIHICKYTSSHGWYSWWFRNPTPVDMVNIPLFTGFYTSHGGFYRISWISEPSMGFLPLTQPASWQTINMKTKAVLEDERRAAVKRKATKRMSTYKEQQFFPAPFLEKCYCRKDPGPKKGSKRSCSN